MSVVTDPGRLPDLFVHSARQQWGVGVIAWEDGGKRGYLFEDGVERTLATVFHELMRRVERPTPDQRAISLRLQQTLVARGGAHAIAAASTPTFSGQLSRLHASFPEGLLDPNWARSVRGEGAELRATAHRDAAIAEARERLSPAALDSLIDAQRFDAVWDGVLRVLARTDLVPAAQIKLAKSARAERLRDLSIALRELLYGKSLYEQRFDRYVAALSAGLGTKVRWELATVLSALVHPKEHFSVQPTTFRLHLKATGSRGSISAFPASMEYMRLLTVAKALSQKLVEHGESPRDLLDVHDFVRVTLKPAAPARAAKAPKAPKGSAATRDADDVESAPDEG